MMGIGGVSMRCARPACASRAPPRPAGRTATARALSRRPCGAAGPRRKLRDGRSRVVKGCKGEHRIAVWEATCEGQSSRNTHRLTYFSRGNNLFTCVRACVGVCVCARVCECAGADHIGYVGEGVLQDHTLDVLAVPKKSGRGVKQ
jgi:hypothetical protein